MWMFKESAMEFKKLSTMVICAMLTALYLVIDSFSIMIGTDIKITFTFLTIAVAGMLYGPVASMAVGALTDILGAILFPKGAYFPGFTITAMVGGLIYGMVLYRKKPSILRAFAAKALVNLFANILINTLWISILYGNAFTVIVGARIIKNAVALLAEVPLLFGFSLIMQQVMKHLSKPLIGSE